MKFTNTELTARMISDQKNGWPFCPRCGKPLKIDPQTQQAASDSQGGGWNGYPFGGRR